MKAMKVLIIEDNAAVRIAMRRYLDPLNIPILEAQNWAEAMVLMSSPPPPGLVFLDLWLPDMPDAGVTLRDGVAKLREINPDAIIVVMTGDTSEDVARIARSVEIDAFRVKTEMQSQVDLWGVMKKALEHRRQTTAQGRGLVESGHLLLEQLTSFIAAKTHS